MLDCFDKEQKERSLEKFDCVHVNKLGLFDNILNFMLFFHLGEVPQNVTVVHAQLKKENISTS